MLVGKRRGTGCVYLYDSLIYKEPSNMAHSPSTNLMLLLLLLMMMMITTCHLRSKI